MKHSKIGASSYYRWKICPGSVSMCEGLPNKESDYALEGSLAHEMAAKILECHFFDAFERATFPVDAAPDFVESIKIYTEYVKKEASRMGCDPKEHVFIEHKFDLSQIHEGLFGTADAVLYDPISKILKVIDYKHGKGIPVDPEGNLQLMYYALGALMSFNFPCDKVVLVVVQPRFDPENPIKMAEVMATDFIDFADQLQKDARRTEKDDAPFVTGDHCRFCPAAAVHCEALRNESMRVARDEFKVALIPHQYDPKRLAAALEVIPALKAWINNVEEFANEQALSGKEVPGFKLVQKRRVRKYNVDEKKMIEILIEVTGKEMLDFVDIKLKTPPALEKSLRKDEYEQVKKYIDNQSTGLTLVPLSDKRSAASPSAILDFKDLALIDVSNKDESN